MSDGHVYLLQRVQPAMVGLIDGSLSTLAPIFAVVLASHDTRYAFIAGLATSLGAAISMGFSEGLSDTGELTGRGNPWVRGSITGGGTFLGGILRSRHGFTAVAFASAVLMRPCSSSEHARFAYSALRWDGSRPSFLPVRAWRMT